MIFDKRKMPFVYLSSNSILVENACGQLASFSCATNTMRTLMNRNASENTKLFGVLIKRQQTSFGSKPIWQSPLSSMQRGFQVLDNLYLNHKVRLKNPYLCLGALCFCSGGGFLLVLPNTVSLPTFLESNRCLHL